MTRFHLLVSVAVLLGLAAGSIVLGLNFIGIGFAMAIIIPLFLWPRIQPDSPSADLTLLERWMRRFDSGRKGARPEKRQNVKGKAVGRSLPGRPARSLFIPSENFLPVLVLIGQLVLFMIAVYLGFLGERFWLDLQRAPGLALFLLGSLLLVAAFWKTQSQIVDVPSLSRRNEIILFCVVMAVGIFMRLWKIWALPPGNWFDEADNGNIAWYDILKGGERPIFIPRGTEPAQWFYVLALFLKVFGVHTVTLRLEAALFGIIALVPFYFILRQVWNERIALMGTFLFAIARWHVNFSRINFNAIQAPFIEASLVYFLIRAEKTGSKVAFALAGMVLGLTLHSYIALRLFWGVVFLYFLYRLVTERGYLKRTGKGLLIGAVMAFVVLSPILYYAVTHWDGFMHRTGQVNISNHVPPDQYWKALKTNFFFTIYQYTVWGDGNGRHNWPTKPLLDPIMSVLCTLGFGYALLDFLAGLLLLPFKGRDALAGERRISFLAVVWFLIMIMPGVLTIEAPQALRTIGAVPAVMLFGAIFLAGSWRLLAAFLGKWEWVSALIIVPVLITSGYLNYNNYFNHQMTSIEVWRSFSTIEDGIGHYVKSLKGKYRLCSDHIDHPTTVFIAGREAISGTQRFHPVESIPYHDRVMQGMAYISFNQSEPYIPLLKYYYPGGVLTEGRDPSGGLLYFAYRVEREELLGAQGLSAVYISGSKTVARTDRAIDFHWKATDLPGPGIWNSEWTGQIYIERGAKYSLGLKSSDSASLWVDDRSVVTAGGGRTVTSTRYFEKGLHNIRIKGRARIGGMLQLLKGAAPQSLQVVPVWSLSPRPSYPNGLNAEYYCNASSAGIPEYRLIDPAICFDWYYDPLIGPWSVEWSGLLKINTPGPYVFKLLTSSPSMVQIDQQVLISSEGGETKSTKTMTKGNHPIRARFTKTGGAAFMKLGWRTPDGREEWIPAEAFTHRGQ